MVSASSIRAGITVMRRVQERLNVLDNKSRRHLAYMSVLAGAYLQAWVIIVLIRRC